jgi:hypothetical protein
VSFIADLLNGGWWPLQDHRENIALSTRTVRGAVRVKGLDEAEQLVLDREACGDILGGVCWPAAIRPMPTWGFAVPTIADTPPDVVTLQGHAGGVDVLGSGPDGGGGGGSGGKTNVGEKKGKGGLHPGPGGHIIAGGIGPPNGGPIITIDGRRQRGGFKPGPGGSYWRPPGRGGIPGATADNVFGQNLLRYLGPIYDLPGKLDPSNPDAGPSAGGDVKAWQGQAQAINAGESVEAEPVRTLPIWGSDYVTDTRMRGLRIPLPLGWPSLPNGSVGTVLPSTEEAIQDPVYAHGDPRLVANHRGGRADHGTTVYDLTEGHAYDLETFARLGSMMRVVRTPNGVIPMGQGNALAWLLTRAGRSGVAGYGIVIDAPDGRASATEIIPGEVSVASGGGKASASFESVNRMQPAGLESLPSTTSQASAAPVIGGAAAGVASGAGSAQGGAENSTGLVVALSSARAGGPLEVGSQKDQHRLGVTGEGEPINANHLTTSSLFRADDEHDAPMAFARRDYPKVTPFPYKAPVHFELNRSKRHHFPGGIREGLWDWWAEVPMYIPTGGGPPTRSPGDGEPPPTGGPPTKTPGDPTPTPPTTTPPTTTPTPVNPPANEPPPPQITPTDPPVTTPIIGDQYSDSPADTPFNRPRGPGTPPPFSLLQGADRVRAHDPGDGEQAVSATNLPLGTTAQTFRPQPMSHGSPDFRTAVRPTDEQVARYDAIRPTTLRLEAYGAEQVGEYTYTQRPAGSRYPGGTGPGGVVYLPPEVDLGDSETDYAHAWESLSTPYVVFGPSVRSAWALPNLTTGGVKTGVTAYRDTDGTLIVAGVSAAGALTTALKVGTAGGIGFLGAAPTTRQTYLAANVTPDRGFDADATTLAEVADVLGTLVADLQTLGLLA